MKYSRQNVPCTDVLPNALNTTARTSGLSVPHPKFRADLFRQPSLAEGHISPQAYRKVHSFSSPYRFQQGYGESTDHTPLKDRGAYRANQYQCGSPQRDQSSENTREGRSPVYQSEQYYDEEHGESGEAAYQNRLEQGLHARFAESGSGSGEQDLPLRQSTETVIPFASDRTPSSSGYGIGTGHRDMGALDGSHLMGKKSARDYSGDYDGYHKPEFEDPKFAQSYSWMREEADGCGSDSEDEMDIDVNEILDIPRDNNRGQNSNSHLSSRPLSGRIDPRTAADAVQKAGPVSGAIRSVSPSSLGVNLTYTMPVHFNNISILLTSCIRVYIPPQILRIPTPITLSLR